MGGMSEDQKGMLRMLMYPVIFNTRPVDQTERVFTMIFEDRKTYPNANPEDYSLAIDAGLNSKVKLSKLLPQPHPEAVIREYLSQFQLRLRRTVA